MRYEYENLTKEEFLKKKMIDDFGSVRRFSQKAEIPYTTVLSILNRGVAKAGMSNVIAVCKALGLSTSFLDEWGASKICEPAIDYSISTLAAHHDEEDWTDEERNELESFKAYLRSKRHNK